MDDHIDRIQKNFDWKKELTKHHHFFYIQKHALVQPAKLKFYYFILFYFETDYKSFKMFFNFFQKKFVT